MAQMSPASVSSVGLHEISFCFMLAIQLGSPFCIPQTLMDKLNGAVKAHGKTEVARILAEVPLCRCCEGTCSFVHQGECLVAVSEL